ncbi:MAG: CoA transferase [Rhizobiaceae bacterium]
MHDNGRSRRSPETRGDAFGFCTRSDRKPLAGIRVVDAGNMVAAPFASVLMADLGAEVIKIEHPLHGDGQRKLEPFKDGISLWWKCISRNKRCVTLDLSKPEGANVFFDLVKGADVVLENYRPGTLERWGLGPDKIRAAEPKAVIVRISGFGQDGPYRDRPGFGRIGEAMSGLTHLIGDPDGPPMSPGYPLGDLITGLFAAYSTMVALHHRDKAGGDGQVVDISLFESLFRLLDFDPLLFQQTGEVHTRSGNQVAYAAPSSTYETSDGRWITMAASTHNVWLRLCTAMGRDDLPRDPKFADNAARVKHSNEINGIVADWIAARTSAEVRDAFDAAEVAYSGIFDMRDVFEDPQYIAREALIRLHDQDLGEAVVQNVVPKFSATPGSVDWLGREKGFDNEAIYVGELGYSVEKLAEYRKLGVI